MDASVRTEGHDCAGLERVLRYCARPAFALKRIERIEDERTSTTCPIRPPTDRLAA